MKVLEDDMDILQRDNYTPEPPVMDYTEIVLSDDHEVHGIESSLLKESTSSTDIKTHETSEEKERQIEKENESSNNIISSVVSVTMSSDLSETLDSSGKNSNHSLQNVDSLLLSETTDKVLTLPVPTLQKSDTYSSTEKSNSDLSSVSISLEGSYRSVDSTEIDEINQSILHISAVNQINATNTICSSQSCDIFVNRQNSSTTSTTSSSSTSKTQQYLPPCRICGEKASGFHYGVNTCEACKGFFRRSIKRVNQYKCVESNNNCVIEPGKRNICPRCRYDKCLKVGMSKSAIKTGRYTHEKRSQDIREIKKLEKKNDPVPEVVINENMEEAKELAALLVQAQKDMYGKNYEYWISNDMIYSLAKEYHKQYQVKTDMFGDLNKIPEEEFKTFYQTTGIDIDNRFELMSEIATTLENGVSRYIHFVKTIPGFTSLCLEDQAALIKVSRFEFWFVGYQRFVCADLGVTTGIMQQCYAMSELAKVFGTEFAEQLFYHSKKMQELNLTIDDIAVLRSFLVFSPDRCELKDRDAVERIQWKLLMCMNYLFELNHKPEEHYMSKVIDRVASMRVISELNEKRAQCIKLEWPMIKNHPLLLELMSG